MSGHPAARIRVQVLHDVQSAQPLDLEAAESTIPADELLRLQRASYAIEAALIGDDRIPALHETASELSASDRRWLVTLDDQPTGDPALAGAIGYRVLDDDVDIGRLVVDPRFHRRGIGRRLVTAVLGQARSATVSTGRNNAPARRLYESHGFGHIGDREVIEGLWISEYRWIAAPLTPLSGPPAAGKRSSVRRQVHSR